MNRRERLLVVAVLLLAVAFLLTLALVVSAQTVEVSGGSSTLFNAAGGSVALFSNNATTTFSLGDFNGQIIPGVTERFRWRGWDATLGNRNLFLTADGGGLTVPLTGASWEREGLLLFAGAAGTAYYAPFAFANRPRHLGAGYRFERDLKLDGLLTGTIRVTSFGAVAGGRKTSLHSVRYIRTPWLAASLTGGWLENRPLINGLATVNRGRFGGSVAKSTWFLPAGQIGVLSGAVWGGFQRFDGAAAVFRGRSNGWTVGGGWRPWDSVAFRANHFRSSFGRSTSYAATEKIRRFTVTETIARSNGRWNLDFGGGYASNRFSVSVGHQEVFTVAGRWERIWAISLNLRLPHDSSVSVETLARPDGKVGYGIVGGTYFYGSGGAPGTSNGSGVGKYVVSGIVRDTAGKPVEGAAVRIDGARVAYTDSGGRFAVSFRKSRRYTLAVLTDEFLSGKWRVVSAPSFAFPGDAVTIVVAP